MSLKKCKECGNPISTKAKNCPNCGNPVQKKTSCMSIGCLVIVSIIIISVIVSSLAKTVENSVSWGQTKYAHSAVNIRSDRSKTSIIVNTLASNEAIKVDFLKDNWYAVFHLKEKERKEENALGYVFAPILFDTKLKKEIANANVNNSNDFAYQLATINKGGYVSKSDVSITRFNYLLKTLDEKTFESKQEIGDITVTCQKILKEKYGIEMKLLRIMEDLNKSIPSGSKVKYAEIATVYIQLVK